jgi:hypothetical protein
LPLSSIPFRASLVYFWTSEFGAVVFFDLWKYILLQNQHCPNLIQDRMDPTDRHEVVIVEAKSMAIVETRCGFPVPFDTTSWFCVTKIFHRSQVSEWEVQGWASPCCRDHGLPDGLQAI